MELLRFTCSIALAVLLGVMAAMAAPKEALIASLPGFTGHLPSQHYAGYVAIDGKSEGKKNLFYYFVASQRDPSRDPVVLWLNGGPGCSSFDGFVYEHGPFNFQPGNSGGSIPILHLNPYSWSKVSNIIYLDSPCGVGFSYSDNPNNYVTGDFQTASDTHAFLLKWFELYPEFLHNPFYISGESYAGVYVPTLASQVVKGMKIKGYSMCIRFIFLTLQYAAGIEGSQQPLINFKGYLIGNGISSDRFFDRNSLVPFAFGMALISSDMFQDCQATCHGKYYDPPTQTCHQNLMRVYNALEGLNIYNILEPCYTYASAEEGNGKAIGPSSFMGVHGKGNLVRPSGRDGRVPLDANLEDTYHVPCINDDLATAWLNDEAVRKAIHAAPSSVAGRWMICAYRVDYTHETDTLLPYHKNLTSKGYRALIYSGDHDLAVPYTGTEAWTRSMGYKMVEQWRSWWSNKQVAGYLQAYEKNLTFLTVKGAGHMVPQYKPRESLDFYTRWLDGKMI
ncbi:hypothetical protein SAY86_000041 [Trapa natans]|uniref:Carboxypeptidase n=1 Tax=Trapa natans TaxID=22666 RepID=A0AAN7M3E2_TRANT|nr:hypothetical protein SAY86_000041 [Trapa natans]